tara:strand:- start:18377 stop:19006 length:630 start_codon:yes stop_codon:yes gene_type:complete
MRQPEKTMNQVKHRSKVGSPYVLSAIIGLAAAIGSCRGDEGIRVYGEELLLRRHFTLEAPPEPGLDWDAPHSSPVIVSMLPKYISQGKNKTETLVVDLGISIGMPIKGTTYSYRYDMESNTGETVPLADGATTMPAEIPVGQSEFHIEVALPGSVDGFYEVTTRVEVNIPGYSPGAFEGGLMYAVYNGQVWGVTNISDWLAGVGNFGEP